VVYRGTVFIQGTDPVPGVLFLLQQAFNSLKNLERIAGFVGLLGVSKKLKK